MNERYDPTDAERQLLAAMCIEKAARYETIGAEAAWAGGEAADVDPLFARGVSLRALAARIAGGVTVAWTAVVPVPEDPKP